MSKFDLPTRAKFDVNIAQTFTWWAISLCIVVKCNDNRLYFASNERTLIGHERSANLNKNNLNWIQFEKTRNRLISGDYLS